MGKHRKTTKKALGLVTVLTATGTALAMTTSAHADTTTIRSADFLPTLSDTRDNGLVTVGDKGIGVYTEIVGGDSYNAKAAEYWKAEVSLAQAGEPTLDWKGTALKPGKQLYVDFDNDPSTGMYNNTAYKGADGILVGEMYTGTDGKPSWWLSTSATAATKATAPQHADGGNTQWQGTLDEWRAAFPSAKVVATGFSMGSGATGSGIITKVTVGDTTYNFAGKDAPVVTPPAPVDYSEAVKVTKVQFDPAGSDTANPNGEYVQVKNRISTSVTLTGYKLVDATGNSYTFPSGFTLPAGATVTVYAGSGTNTATKLYRGKSSIWNNDGDAAVLKRANGTVTDACAYNSATKVFKSC